MYNDILIYIDTTLFIDGKVIPIINMDTYTTNANANAYTNAILVI